MLYFVLRQVLILFVTCLYVLLLTITVIIEFGDGLVSRDIVCLVYVQCYIAKPRLWREPNKNPLNLQSLWWLLGLNYLPFSQGTWACPAQTMQIWSTSDQLLRVIKASTLHDALSQGLENIQHDETLGKNLLNKKGHHGENVYHLKQLEIPVDEALPCHAGFKRDQERGSWELVFCLTRALC